MCSLIGGKLLEKPIIITRERYPKETILGISFRILENIGVLYHMLVWGKYRIHAIKYAYKFLFVDLLFLVIFFTLNGSQWLVKESAPELFYWHQGNRDFRIARGMTLKVTNKSIET